MRCRIRRVSRSKPANQERSTGVPRQIIFSHKRGMERVQSAGITRATAARKLVSTLIAGLTYCTFLGARLSRSRTMAETQCK